MTSSTTSQGRIRRAGGRVASSLRAATARTRLMLAAKTALAVGLAWAVAPHMPGVTDEYPYYAPLGALVSIYPTVIGSVRTAVQTILGLAVGIGLATVLILTAGPTWWTLPIVAAAAVLLSGTGWFAAGREYVPMAALLVLMIGGSDPEAYSLGYLVQMGVGVAIGLVVNVVIAPAPFGDEARARIGAFREDLAGHLEDLAGAIEEGPGDDADWKRRADALADTARDVGRTVAEAEESRRANPRARGRRARVDRDEWEALSTMVFHVRDISGTLTDALTQQPWSFPLDERLGPALSAACRAVARAIRAAGHDADEVAEAREDARREVDELIREAGRLGAEDGDAVGPAGHTAMHLNRILRLLPERDETASSGRAGGRA